MAFELFKQIFSGGRTVETDKRAPRRPQERDMTGGLVANAETLKGLYYGTAAKLQFASATAFTPVSMPVMIMGVPTPVVDKSDEATKDAVARIVDLFMDDFSIIHRVMLRNGTAWRWPRYNANTNSLIWEMIPDECITDLEIDILSGEIKAVYTHDNFKVTRGEGQIAYVERKRKITRERIDVRWVTKASGLPLEDSSSINVFGTLPIPFGHDCDEGEWRGHSVYGRILRLMRASHEIELARDEELSLFKPKLVQTVKDVGKWLDNNGYAGVDEVDVFSADMFLNMAEEKTEFLHLPSDATKQYNDALADSLKRIIIGSGVPELFWGPIATGNAASTDSQKDMAIGYISYLREEVTKAYTRLINDSLKILSFVEMARYQPVKIKWDAFDMVSAEARARIFQAVSSGIAALVNSAGGTKDDMLFFWRKFFPDFPETEIAAFSAGITAMASHKALSTQDIATLQDLGAGGAE
jgi:hypothetical protein